MPHNHSVQFVIETALSSILKTSVTIVGCGRTDSHVHASQYFFHADVEPFPVDDLKFRLNKILPDDIAVFDIIPVDEHAHARLSAIERTYTYFIHRTKDPFLNSISSLYQHEFDIIKIKHALDLLPAYNDYRNFHRQASKPKTTICKVTSVSLWITDNEDRLRITISANRFLRGMVRIIVHKLLEVGRGKINVDNFENYLKGSDTPRNIKSAYPQGLYLTKVKYPFLECEPASRFDMFRSTEASWKKVI